MTSELARSISKRRVYVGTAGALVATASWATFVSSGKLIRAASEEFFVRLRYWLPIGGTPIRIAWGSTTYQRRWKPDSANASAASPWPRGTAWIDARTISAMWLAV